MTGITVQILRDNYRPAQTELQKLNFDVSVESKKDASVQYKKQKKGGGGALNVPNLPEDAQMVLRF